MAQYIGESNGNHKIEDDGPRINEVAQKFLADLSEERERLSSEFPLCALLIDDAFERVYTTGRIPGTEFLADVYKRKPIKVTQKVYVPVKQYPKFNFTGKLLGPKGNTLRRLHEETQCKIIIKGRGSMRDRNKEEELRQTNDPRYAHLHRNLFVEISTVAEPAEAHARIAYALSEIRKYLIPDKNDEVSQEQLRELMKIDPKSARTLMDKISTEDGSKFLNFIKRNVVAENYANMDESYEEDEYQSRFLRREGISPYGKVPSKRPPIPLEEYGYKRTRETPIKTNKPVYKTILNRYK